MKPYPYTECGLENIIIEADLIAIDDKEENIVTIPAIDKVHNIIAQGLIAHENTLSSTEIRFLRTEVGITQAELAQLLHRDTQTIGRWERGEGALDATQDIFYTPAGGRKAAALAGNKCRKAKPESYIQS